MKIITVIPISRGIGKDTLTYFTKEDVSVGSIVSVPLRSKTAHGLVTTTREIQDAKSDVKGLSYNLKKIDKIKSESFLSESFVKSASDIADYYATTAGAVLSALVPKAVLESDKEFFSKSPEKENVVAHEVLLLQSADEERYATYKSIIREEFARGKSVFFCLPTTEDIKNARSALEKGIEIYTFTLHGGLSKKETAKLWQKILAESHPVLIVATGLFLSLPRADIGTIILEKESSRAYKMQSRPFLDIRTVAEIIAKNANRKLIFGDMLLRVETLWKQKNGEYQELSPLKFRSLSVSTCSIVNMREPADMKKKEFAVISGDLKKMLSDAWQNSERTFLFCGRKGLYPQTVCSDCGTVVACKNCGAPVVLYKKKVGDKLQNFFVCHHCGERRDAAELCVHCRGWRLMTLGIGTERVFEDVKVLFPDRPIFLMDTEHVKTHAQAIKTRDNFYDTAGAICVGTEMALTYLNQKIENTAVVSVDSFFSVPDFRLGEKVFHILLEMRAETSKKMLIQTRRTETKIFDYAVSGNLIDFYRDEINERKNMGFPPFSTYVKLTLEGSRAAVKKNMEEIVKFLRPFEVSVFDALIPGKNNACVAHGLFSLPRENLPNKGLLEKLRALPPFCAVKIDPDTLL
jgi:primosomal protein N' (replication factor Y)